MMIGMLLGILTYRPIFNEFLKETDIVQWKLENPIQTGTGVVSHDSLPDAGKKYIRTNNTVHSLTDGRKFTTVTQDTLESILPPPYYMSGEETGIAISELNKPQSGAGIVTYKDKHLSSSIYWKFVGLVFLLIFYVTMVYGPIAAFLVEMFPTKIRYTSMSLPYHIGNGVFGGLVPFIGLLLTTTYPTDPLVGLWYPISIATLCLIIGTIYLTNKIDKEVND